MNYFWRKLLLFFFIFNYNFELTNLNLAFLKHSKYCVLLSFSKHCAILKT